MRSNRAGWAMTVCGCALGWAGPTPARADVGPPVKLTMPADSPMAVAGRPYKGQIEADVRKAGVIENIKVEGEGWTVQSLDRSLENAQVDAGVLHIPFIATPTNPEAPLRLGLRFDGRPVTRSLRLGAAAFARRGQDRSAVQVVAGTPKPAGARGGRRGGSSPEGGAITLQFTGRIVYERPSDVMGEIPIWFGATFEGVHLIRVEVIDEDDGFDETIWSGNTDKDGCFDSGPVSWDDCDTLGCDEPDIYLRWESDTGIVNVQDGEDILQPDYSWSTEETLIYDDFTGPAIEFGAWAPAEQTVMAALHIHNSITRAHEFIRNKSGLGLDVPEVDALWPYDAPNAFYDGELNFPHSKEWNEGTHTHEYGHHFLTEFSNNVEPDYCFTPDFCDGVGTCQPGTDCEDPGHCQWCPETDHDAWNEGFPNWLANVVTRDYEVSYTFSDGSPYQFLIGKETEILDVCCQDDQSYSPWITQGYIEALMRDIEDGVDPEGNSLQDDHDGDGMTDCLSLGYDEVFTIAAVYDVTTPEQFINAFLTEYPQHRYRLYSTAFNVHPEFVNPFPQDAQSPGPVPAVTSPTHPLGVGGPLPCITVKWDVPPDDVTGGCAYSYEWSTSPAGVEPDMTEEADAIGSCVTVQSGPFNFGDHYISIRAKDCAEHWSAQWATFGPFTVNECNGNGFIDLCEISCDPSTLPNTPCGVGIAFCSGLFTMCGFAGDCNCNFVPDDCDLASGFSEDCDENGVPDECEGVAHWGNGSGSWHAPGNWEDPGTCPPPPNACGVVPPCPTLPPVSGHVCIDQQPDVTVTYENGPANLARLACDDNLTLANPGGPAIALTLSEPSFVRGDLTMGNGSYIINNGTFSVGGTLVLTGSNSSSRRLAGAGPAQIESGIELGANSTIEGKTLTLGGSSVSHVTTGGLSLTNNGVLRTLAGSIFDVRRDPGGSVISGTTGTLINEGYVVRSVGAGQASITCRVENAGEVRVQTGTLLISRGGSHTGQFVAEPGALLIFDGGNHDFLAASSIVAADIEFAPGAAGENHVRGTYNVSGTSTFGGQAIWFHPEANVIDYGDHLIIDGGTVHFNYVSGTTVQFETVLADGTADFASGDPIQTQTLSFGHGGGGGGSTITGTGSITVDGMLTWMSVGTFFGALTINANGGLLVHPSNSSRNIDGGAVFNNAGYATFQGAIGCRGGGKFNNLPSGTVDITVDGNILTRENALPIDNAGLIVKTAGTGTSNIKIELNNTGAVEVRTGELEFDRTYVQTAGQTFLNGGNLRMGGTPTIQPVQIRGGSLRGAGTITGDVEVAVCSPGPCTAVVIPGTSTGILNITKDLTFGEGGTLKIELGGLNPGTQHDQVTVGGTADIQGGVIDVAPAGGFIPQVGQEFVILTAANVQGTFDAIVGPGEYSATYNPTNVTLIVDALPCTALVGPDFDQDCDVDGGDVAAFEACASGPTVPYDPGCDDKDFDADGDADQDDFGVVQKCVSGPGFPADPNCAS